MKREGNRVKFDEECKVIIDTMDASEARAFVKFLKSEILRHKMDIDNAEKLMYDVCIRFKIDKDKGD